MASRAPVSESELIGFMSQDSATQTDNADIVEFKTVLRTFEHMRQFAEGMGVMG